MRRLIPLILALGALAAFVPPTAAAKPDRNASPIDGFVIEGLCEFDVQLDILVDRFHATDFYDRDGNLVRTIYNGSIRIRVTNLETNVSVDLNVGGPGIDVYNADGTVTSTFLGLGIPLLTDSNLTRGRFEFLFSADFSEVIATQSSGFTQDLCEVLGI